jgi:hypothetical protein
LIKPKPSLAPRLLALQTASRFAPGGPRILTAPGEVNPLRALLAEIEETLLARTLRFETDAGARLELEVAGRRLLRLAAASGVTGAETCLAAPALDDSHLADLVRVLSAFARPGCALNVVVSPLDRAGDGVSVGLPVARLLDALSIDAAAAANPAPEPMPEPASSGDLLHRMIDRMGPSLVAWILHSPNRADQRGGPEEMVQPLGRFLDEEFAALNLMCLRADGAVLVGIIKGDATSPVLAAWTAASR